MNKSKLLLIGHTYMISTNREKACALANHFQVRVCTSDSIGWKALGEEIVDEEDPAHQGVYELKRLDRWPRWPRCTKITLRGLAEEIQEFQPDVVLVENEPWSWLRWQARWHTLRRAPRARFVEFTWENVPRPGIRGLIVRLIYRFASWTADRVICGNQAAKHLFMKAGVRSTQILVDGQLGENDAGYPSATPEERATWRKSLGWEGQDLVIGYCGRLVAEKGLTELVEAASRLRDRFPQLRVVFVGAGPLLTSLQAADPSGTWIQFLPPVSHREVPNFLNKLDVFVLPSKALKSLKGEVWEEQFGHVLIESMACGTLTLGSDSGAIPEVLNDAEMVFRQSDADDLERSLARWLAADEERCAKALYQRRTCLARWSHDALAARYADFLLNEPYRFELEGLNTQILH